MLLIKYRQTFYKRITKIKRNKIIKKIKFKEFK